MPETLLLKIRSINPSLEILVETFPISPIQELAIAPLSVNLHIIFVSYIHLKNDLTFGVI